MKAEKIKPDMTEEEKQKYLSLEPEWLEIAYELARSGISKKEFEAFLQSRK